MARRPRRNHSPAFKANVARDAIRGEKTIAPLRQKQICPPTGSPDCKHQLLERAATVFGAADLVMMRRIDALRLEFPPAGACMLGDTLRREAQAAGRKRVSTLMANRGIEALYCKPTPARGIRAQNQPACAKRHDH